MPGISPGSPDEKREYTNVEELLLSPVNRLLVRELFCCLPELGDGRLIAKIVANLWIFCELNAIR